MSIRFRILLACLSLTAITVASGILARASQAELGGFAFQLYDEAFMSMSYLRSAQNTVLSLSRDMRSPGVALAEVEDRLDSAQTDIQVARERSLSPEGASAAWWLQDRIRAVLEQVRAGSPLDQGTLAQIEDHFDAAVEINAGDGFKYRRRAVELVKHVEAQMWSLIALAVVVALLITTLLSRAIVPSVRHAVGIAANIAAGRLDNPIPTGGSGETAVLLRALATMQASIADKMAQIEALMAQQASSHASEIAVQHVRFETALDNMVQGLAMLNDRREVLVHNRRFGEMFAVIAPGRPLDDVLPPALLLPDPANGNGAARTYTRLLDDERSVAVSERPMKSGGWVVTYEDVSERHRSEARMAYLERHDALTGLANRLCFRDRLVEALREARSPSRVAVLCCNLDNFQNLNDALGHSVGDALLCEVSRRLLAAVSDGDTVGRLGGDEFGVLQRTGAQPNAARALAERLCAVVAEPFSIDDHPVTIGVTIGIAIHDGEAADADVLLKSADMALFGAKLECRGAFRFFETEMDARIQARRRLESDLRQAVEQRQFVTYYQPLVMTQTRVVSGFEALVRWVHPTRGTVSPAEFIPVAEEIGLIAGLGAIVLEQACHDAAAWPEPVKVAVNLSPLQFRNPLLVEDVVAALERSGLPASRLELEVTESVMLQDGDAVVATLHRLRGLGVRVSMDDFGTGYSSLGYLRRFPFDKIKIDQSFVRNLRDNNDCLAIVRAVLGLGRSLGMQVVAEGVETEEQYALLHREGCEQLQGYLFSKPRPNSEVPAVIARHRLQQAA